MRCPVLVVAALALAISAARGHEADTAEDGKPSAAPKAAAPHTSAAKAGAGGDKAEQNIVKRALVAAGAEYDALAATRSTRVAHALEAKLEDASDKARKHSAKVHVEVTEEQSQASKDMHEALRKETEMAVKAQAAVTKDSHAGKALKKAGATKKVDVESGGLQEIELQEKKLDDEVKSKKQEEQVQSELAEEKKQAVAKEAVVVKDLQKTSEKYRKEADVAAEIAKEKSDAAMKSETQERQEEKKMKDLGAEQAETAKFLDQTKREESSLEGQRAELEGKRKALVKAEAARKKQLAMQHQRNAEEEARRAQKEAEEARSEEKQAEAEETNATGAKSLVNATEAQAAPESKATSVQAKEAKAVPVVKVQVQTNATTRGLNAEDIQKILLENQELRKEKQELEQQLTIKQKKQEEDMLRRKLKSKLIDKDRQIGKRAKLLKH